MHGFLNILFWRCNALPMPFVTTAFGAVVQKDLWLCLILVHLDLSRWTAEILVLKCTNYLLANIANMF